MDPSSVGAGDPAALRRRGFLGGVLAVCGGCLVTACGTAEPTAGAASSAAPTSAASSATAARTKRPKPTSSPSRDARPSKKATREPSPSQSQTTEPQPTTSASTREPRPTDDPTTKEPKPTKSSSTPKPTDPSEGSIVRTKDVPVGGGVVVSAFDVVVTQPTSGDFRAFAARCTHRGCLLGPVSSAEIRCPCHSSRFSIEDGSPIYGPAPTALPSVPITVDKGYVYPA